MATAQPPSYPPAYLLTFTTYGTWLHGDMRGSVDPDHNVPGTPHLEPDPLRRDWDRLGLKHSPLVLTTQRRAVVERSIRSVCDHCGWSIHALNVRTNHVHLVISAEEKPERIMNDLKSWATRRMVEATILDQGVSAWTRHGSTRYLWNEEQLVRSCRYVVEGQGLDKAAD